MFHETIRLCNAAHQPKIYKRHFTQMIKKCNKNVAWRSNFRAESKSTCSSGRILSGSCAEKQAVLGFHVLLNANNNSNLSAVTAKATTLQLSPCLELLRDQRRCTFTCELTANLLTNETFDELGENNCYHGFTLAPRSGICSICSIFRYDSDLFISHFVLKNHVVYHVKVNILPADKIYN